MKNNDCHKGYPDGHGDCCCNCVYRLELRNHPANKSEIFTGNVTDEVGAHVCTVDASFGQYSAEIQDWDHWVCELHIRRPLNNKDKCTCPNAPIGRKVTADFEHQICVQCGKKTK